MESWELEAQFQAKLNELREYFEAEITQLRQEIKSISKSSSKRSKGLTVDEMIEKIDSTVTFAYMGNDTPVVFPGNTPHGAYSVQSKIREGRTFWNYVGALCTEIRDGETLIPTSRQIKEAIDKYAILLISRYRRGQITNATREQFE